MDDRSVLKLRFRTPDIAPDANRKLDWRGFSVEHTCISDPTPYSFQVTGERHYLALHDLVLDEGEMTVDGLAPVAGGDLRNRLTYMPRHCRASGFATPKARSNSFTSLHFDPEIVSSETERFYDGLDGRPMVYFDDRRLRSTLEKLRSIVTADDPESHVEDIYAETLGLLTVIELALLQAKGSAAAAAPRHKLSDAQRSRVFDYVEEKLSSELTLDAMAGVANLSRFHFARAFKETVGIPPYAYVLQRRIELSKRLLSTTRLSVGEVALATGFKTPSHFIKAFQNATGTTPGIYRRS